MKLKTVLIPFLVMCSAAFAANDQVPKDRTISEINVYENEVSIKFDPVFSNTQGCPDGANNTAVIDLENGQGKQLYSAALAAATAKLNVGFGLSGCKNSPKIYRIDLAY